MEPLSLVIPATRTATLDRCLAAVRAAADPPEEVIVIDAPAGGGPAAARNVGACRARHDLVAFIDADVLVHRDAFTRIRAAFAEDPGLTAVFGSYDDAPEDPGVVSGFRNLLHHAVHQSAAGPATTFWSGLGAVRREPLLAAGGYDGERFDRPSIEDVELGMRLVDAGGAIRLDPGLQGTHLKRWTLASMVRTDVFSRGVPWVGLLLRRRASSRALNLGWRHRISALASVGLVAAAVTMSPLAAAVSLLVLLALNARFYLLVARRRGWAHGIASVGLHVVHLLSAVAAVPAGIAAHLRARDADLGADVPDALDPERVGARPTEV